MSSTNRTISFSAQDNGVLSTFDRIKQSAEQVTQELISQANSQSKSGRESLKFIEDQIKAIERRNALDKQAGQVNLRTKASEGNSPADVKQQRKEAVELEKIFQEDRLQTQLMREMIEAIRTSADEEIRRDKDGVRAVLIAGEMSNEDSSDEDVFRRDLQRDQLDTEFDQEKEERRKGSKGRGLKNRAEDVDATVQQVIENPISAAAAAVPIIGGTLAVLTMLGSKLDSARGDYNAKTGRSTGMEAGMTGYGLSTTEYVSMEAQLLRSQGKFRGGEKSLIQQGLSYGIDSGSINSLASTARSEVDGKTASQSLQEMLGIFRKSKLFDIGPDNYLAIEEKVQFQTQLNSMQATQFEGVEKFNSTRVQQAFGMLGGSFTDQRATSTMQGVNNAITSPDNDYKQAFILNSLRKLKPDASLYELQELQEKGVFGDDVIKQLLSDLSLQAGGDERLNRDKSSRNLFMGNVRGMFGLNSEQARLMSDKYLSGQTDFGLIGNKIQGNPGMEYSSKAGPVDQIIATIQDKAAMIGNTMIEFAEKQFNEMMDKGVWQYAKDKFSQLTSYIWESFSEMITRVGDAMEKKWTDMMSQIPGADVFGYGGGH